MIYRQFYWSWKSFYEEMRSHLAEIKLARAHITRPLHQARSWRGQRAMPPKWKNRHESPPHRIIDNAVLFCTCFLYKILLAPPRWGERKILTPQVNVFSYVADLHTASVLSCSFNRFLTICLPTDTRCIVLPCYLSFLAQYIKGVGIVSFCFIHGIFYVTTIGYRILLLL